MKSAASSSSFGERYYRIGPPLKMSGRIFQQKPLGPENFLKASFGYNFNFLNVVGLSKLSITLLHFEGSLAICCFKALVHVPNLLRYS